MISTCINVIISVIGINLTIITNSSNFIVTFSRTYNKIISNIQTIDTDAAAVGMNIKGLASAPASVQIV